MLRRELPANPVVRILHFHCRKGSALGWILVRELKIPHVWECGQEKNLIIKENFLYY